MVKYFSAKRIAFLSVFTALILVVTMFVQVPNPLMGYTNLGDAFIFLGAMCFGPAFAAVSGSIGSALADVLLGYALYAPFTFIVKGLEGFLAGILLRALLKTKCNRHAAVLLSCFIAACEMAAGYFLADSALYGGFASGLAGLANNAIQGAAGIVVAYIFTFVLSRVKDFDKFAQNPLSPRKKSEKNAETEENKDEDHPD